MQSLNGFQTLSIVGVFFSVFCQLVLFLINKKVDNMWALYPTWLLVFMLGTVLRFFSKDDHHYH
ncbi:MAG: hypothetical protein MUF42_00810 [Cytophagaceae bacterium]|jgi:hypothetical protein|nr:hypothetical protein [Cytophagaceae bacterium]